jgi:hypothetical protein
MPVPRVRFTVRMFQKISRSVTRLLLNGRTFSLILGYPPACGEPVAGLSDQHRSRN